VSRRDKLLGKMQSRPAAIRFAEVDALLRYEGFVLFNQRGSHCTYHRPDGRVLSIVRPHGRHKTCHPEDIRKLLRALDS
jgi:predicted RNA binding protein YcfA (HicA-like mRNA interferase family)